MKILWASPLPPTRSGVADYAVELLPELARRVRVRIVSPPGGGADLPDGLGDLLVPLETKPAVNEVQLVHLGNNPHHEWLLGRLDQPRTAVVLHDAVLHHLLVEATLAHGQTARYTDTLRRAHPEAVALARARVLGVTGRRDPFLYPARAAYLDRAAMVVVHSHWAASEVTRDRPDLQVARVGLAVADPGPVDRMEVRRRLGVPPGEVLLVHIGFLTEAKGLFDVLAALAAARAVGVPARLLIVGEGGQRPAAAAAAARLRIEDAVSFSGWAPPRLFRELPAAADLGVVLRDPSAGETSAAVVRFLACGTPVAVTGVRQFLEWPETAAPRVTPGGSAAADLARLIRQAAEDEDWASRRPAARAAYETGHLPALAAQQLIEALERAAIA